MEDAVAVSLSQIHETGQALHKEYVNTWQDKMTTIVERIDAVWDTYHELSLKLLTQQLRGSGTRTRLEPNGNGNTPIPKRDWQSYLKNVENKKELSSFVSKQLVKNYMNGKLFLSTEAEMVLSNKPFDVSALQPCNYAEADTHIILYLAHASSQGHAFVRTVDSDIVVIAIAFFFSACLFSTLDWLWL
ncbi:hypothetical protein GQR58_018915 [Nymphon striatum]|nr:hypothetical protein GQR58_018915 [Nymphon striatum]